MSELRLSFLTVEPFLPGGPGSPEAPGGPYEVNKKHKTGRILARSLINDLTSNESKQKQFMSFSDDFPCVLNVKTKLVFLE